MKLLTRTTTPQDTILKAILAIKEWSQAQLTFPQVATTSPYRPEQGVSGIRSRISSTRSSLLRHHGKSPRHQNCSPSCCFMQLHTHLASFRFSRACSNHHPETKNSRALRCFIRHRPSRLLHRLTIYFSSLFICFSPL